MGNGVNKQDWADYAGPLRATLDEYSRAIVELGKVLGNVSQERYVGRTELSDASFDNIAHIMRHVLGAAHVYVDYIDDAIKQSDSGQLEHEYDISEPTSAMKDLWAAFSRMVATLGQIKNYSESQLSAVKFTVRWGQEYDIEQMLEHAIVHILRHRRQVEIWLAL